MSLAYEQTVVIRVCMDCNRLLDPPFRVHTGFEAIPNTPAMVSHGICVRCEDARELVDEWTAEDAQVFQSEQDVEAGGRWER